MRVHRLDRASGVGLDQGGEDFAVLFAGALGRGGRLKERHQHRGAAHQFLQLAQHEGAAGAFGQEGVEFARQSDRLRAVAALQCGFLEPAVHAQGGGLRGAEAAGEAPGDAAFDDAPRLVDFARLIERRAGDEGAAIRNQFQQARMAQAVQHLADAFA